MPVAYPIDRWWPAHPSRWRPGPRIITGLAMHATSGGPDARNTAERWAGAPRPGEPATCAAIVIGQDAYCIQTVHLSDIAQHAHAASRSTLGIELCAREPRELGPDDPGLPPTPVQLAKAAQVIAWACARLKLPVSRIVVRGHAEVDPETTHTGCPTAAGVDLDALVAMATAL